jgi:hypothetical protein
MQQLGEFHKTFIEKQYSLLKNNHINTLLRRHVACIKSSLLLKIQYKENHYLFEHGCYSVQDFKSRDHKDTESGSTCRERGRDIN